MTTIVPIKPRKASAACRQKIKNEEGWKLAPYVCVAGKWTCAAGHRLYPGDKVPGLTYLPDSWLNKILHKGLIPAHWIGKITEAQAEAFLDADLLKCENAIRDLVRVELNQNQYDALCLFIFNVGRAAFAGSTMLAYLNQRLYGSARREFPKWVHDDHGHVIEGLVNRQGRTAQLFATPIAS